MLSDRTQEARNSTEHLSFDMDNARATPSTKLMLAAGAKMDQTSPNSQFHPRLHSGTLNP